MTTYKTAELEGALLDAAVAKAEGHAVRLETAPFASGWMEQWPKGHWLWIRHPATDWNDAGPIIERERINVECFGDTDGRSGMRDVFWCGSIMASMVNNIAHDAHGDGETPLVAAMRAFVASKLGETVELP